MEKHKNAISPDNTLLDNRINQLEREYEAENADPQNGERLEEVHSLLLGLLGKSYLPLLREYTDRLLAQAGIDPGWFYCKGLKDAGRMVSAPTNFIINTSLLH